MGPQKPFWPIWLELSEPCCRDVTHYAPKILCIVEQYISDRLSCAKYSDRNRAIQKLRYKFSSVYKYIHYLK